MGQEDLSKYLKTNLRAGFSETEIRQALRGVGWNEAQIQEGFAGLKEEEAPGKPGFFAKYRKALLIIIILAVGIPIAGFGSFWVYKKFVLKTPSPSSQEEVQGIGTSQELTPVERDRLRLRDVQSLQAVLGRYHVAYQSYPKSLESLVTQGFTGGLPVDPKTGEPYLYSAFGNPALHYSLSFVLETDFGTLESGLETVTSDNLLPAETIFQQEDLVKETKSPALSQTFSLTDLQKSPFYPGEEVRLEVTPTVSSIFSQARMFVADLDLVDKTSPFGFSFTAPSIPGEYPVKVFVFDQEGRGYFQQTLLRVTDLTESQPRVK
jgi:hypothetical protein